MPRPTLLVLVARYRKGERARPPIVLGRTLRTYFLQKWFNLSHPAAEEALYGSEAIRRFVGIDLGEDPFSDETTILHFRHLLQRHPLTEQFCDAVRGLRVIKGLLLTSFASVEATISHGPNSTKNATSRAILR